MYIYIYFYFLGNVYFTPVKYKKKNFFNYYYNYYY